MESITGHGADAKSASNEDDKRVSISVHSRRKRLCDTDGISAKAVIDGIVAKEILEDDSAKFVKEVKYTQEKVGSIEEEETIITLTWD